MERSEGIKTNKSISYRRNYKNLSGDLKDRYEEKIHLCAGIDPYSIKEKELSIFPQDFPTITVSDITNYLISSISPFTKLPFNAYKSTEAYKFFESGFVLSIGSKKKNDLLILKGRVKHSQKMNETPADAWVLTNVNGKIICAHCTCTAGLSETCSHVGAICFAVASMKESTNIKSVTEELCKWNVPSFKEVSMSEAVNITWNAASNDTKITESIFRLYCDSLSHLSDEKIFQFIEKCNSDGDSTALETILYPEKVKRKTNIRDEVFLASWFNESNRDKTHSELVELGKSISLEITNDEVREISHSTLPHLKSRCSLGLRRGRITGSQFKNCCVASVNNPPITTIRQMINPTNLDNIPSIKYQVKNKKIALEQYKRVAICAHNDFVYSKCGLIINPRIPYFVGSNDGILSCTCHGNGCLEIKCLKVLESDPSFERLTNKPNNILNKEGDIYVLDKTHEIFYQVQLQMNLISLNYCDVVIWSPEIFLLITVQPDVDFWNTAMEKASIFHERVIMPELLGKFYSKYSEANTEEELELIALEIEVLYSDEEGKAELCATSGIDNEMIDTPSSSSRRILEKKQKPPQTTESKQNIPHFRSVELKKAAEINLRNLMKSSIDEILNTFSDYEDHLKRMYDEQVQHVKRHYRSKYVPDLIAFDIITEQQFQAMATFAEEKLVRNLEEEHMSTDVIFDAIIPEWALSIFCKKFDLTRCEALETLKSQSQAIIDSEL